MPLRIVWQYLLLYYCCDRTKLLLKSTGVTLLPLLVTVTRYLLSVTHFLFNGSVTVTSYLYFKLNEVVTSYYNK
jgi:hypothetical protein